MRLPARPPHAGPTRVRRAHPARTFFLRLAGLCLLSLAIVVPGCQALLYGATPAVVPPPAMLAPPAPADAPMDR
jgi:hypothetical protein